MQSGFLILLITDQFGLTMYVSLSTTALSNVIIFQTVHIRVLGLQRGSGVPAAPGALLAGPGASRALQPDRLQRAQLLRPGHRHHALYHG